MLVAISFYKGDVHLARSLAKQMRDSGPFPDYKLITLRDLSTDENPFLDVGFSEVKELTIRDRYEKWPQSPNAAFGKIATYIHYKNLGPFLFLEPDVVIVKESWLRDITRVYLTEAIPAGKLFMGQYVEGIQNTPDHLSGVSVYPGNMKSVAGKATVASGVPWDVDAADQIMPQAYFTKLIQHRWYPPGTPHLDFSSMEVVKAELHPETVLYHQDKTGMMAKTLEGGDETCQSEPFRHQAQPSSVDSVECSTTLLRDTIASNPAPTSEPESAGVPLGCSPPGSVVVIKDRTVSRMEGAAIINGQVEHDIWANLDEAIANIRKHVEILNAYADSASRTRIVRQELHNSGLVKVPGYRKRRRE